jgi:diaminopimelate epimerase
MTQGTAQRIPFFKMTGAGNDFILIDNRKGILDANHCQDLVRKACRHKFSVGADGMILIENDPEVDFKWRFFNADASEAEMCGNGARCAARFAYLTGIVARPGMSFRTIAGIIKAEISGSKVKVQMTMPNSLQTDIRLNVDGVPFELDFINTGVPHVVCFAADEQELESTDILHWGRALRFHPRFQPAGTNANFVCVRDARHISVRTYERGVEGETLACGTGAIASALISAVRDRIASPVEVRTRSGESLAIYFDLLRSKPPRNEIQFREIYMEGEARVVYEADLWDETL